MDIASLGFKIDSSQAVKAAEDLDKLHDEAERAEKAVEKLDQQIRQLNRVSGDVPGAMSRAVSDTSGTRSAADRSSDGSGGIDGAMERATEGTDQMGRASKVSADSVKEMRSELFELGKALVSGDASLGMFIEQGFKMAEIIGSSGASLGAWAQALGLCNPIVLAVAAAVGVAVGAFALFQSDLNKHAKDKAYLESLGFTGAEIEKLGKSTITAGDIFKGFWMTLDEGGRITKVFEQVKTFAEGAFRSIIDGVIKVSSAIAAYYVTAFKTISYVFGNFPGMVKDAFITAVNAGIEAVNGLLKAVVDGFNGVGQHLNRFFGKELFGKMADIKIAPLDNDSAGKMKGFVDILANGKNQAKGIEAAINGAVKAVGTNTFRVKLAEANATAASGDKGGPATAAQASTTGGGCKCAAGTARDGVNDNDPLKAHTLVKQVENSLDEVVVKGGNALKDLANLAEETYEALHPVRDQIALIGQDLSKSLGQAIANGENLGDVLSGAFKRIAAEWASKGIQKIFDTLIGEHGSSSTGSLWGMVSSGDLGTIFKGAGDFLSGLFKFDGGGYTGDGSRSGGLDGKGGFLAVMHPRESVIDHTKRGGGSAGQNVHVSVSVTVDDEGRIQAYVRDTSARAVQAGISQYDAAMPQRVAAISNDPRRR